MQMLCRMPARLGAFNGLDSVVSGLDVMAKDFEPLGRGLRGIAVIINYEDFGSYSSCTYCWDFCEVNTGNIMVLQIS
jgi:hypothetical protein